MAEAKELFKSIAKSLGDEVPVFDSSDISLASFVPFGVSSGLPFLDYNLGNRGGFPAGRVFEFYGLPHCGKTALALQAVAEYQRVGGECLWVETEFTFDAERAKTLGVDVDRLKVIEVGTIEDIFNGIDKVLDGLDTVDWAKPFLFVVDSITAVPTKAMAEKEMKAFGMVGIEAKQIRSGMKRIVSRIARRNANMIFVNHAVATIPNTPYAKQTASAGGNAIKFASSARIELKNKKMIKEGTGKDSIQVGSEVELFVEKLKGGIAFDRKPTINFYIKSGFSAVDSLFDVLFESGKMERSGNTYSMFFDEDEPVKFAKKDWPEVCEAFGGWRKIYTNWKEEAKADGSLIPWGTVCAQ